MKESKKKGPKRQSMPNDSDYKTRNILTPEQRLEVLREYDKKPIYQAIATKFKCSAKQIKTIILKRNKIEREMANTTNMETNASPSPSSSSQAVADAANNPPSMQMIQNKRKDKIIFMNKVIYEYMERTTYYNHPIDSNTILDMANQVKEAIAIENFRPNLNWLKNFMGTHKLKYFDLKVLQKRFARMGPKESSLRCYDIIEYVRLQEQGDQMPSPQNENHHHTINIKSEEDLPEQNDAVDQVLQPQAEMVETAPLPEISNLPEAINYLKALQDYALFQENFRAVGLLTQVEEVIENPPSSQDFE